MHGCFLSSYLGHSNTFHPSGQTDKNTLGFFSLPAELRNKIYELIVEHRDPIFVAKHGHSVMCWLQKLGTRAHLIRRLDIDLDVFFSSLKGHNFIPMADQLLSLRPLVEFLRHNDLHLTLNIDRCESEDEDGTIEAYHTTSRASNPIRIDLNRPALNSAIASLNRDDLGLKPHARLIAQMAVKLDGSGDLVTFSTTEGGSHLSTKLGLAPYGFQAAQD
ncbi:hypothetical protein HBH56_193020 [Parastagonospora nodorum]|uniref:Uncharacterized protein n=1 Tax=Phaeosphaeria nodorum (strain SN15 / ATCC MYA-4574 / FGSC 10173) TaxID=321614 RepID=A0A7U2FCV8_PHANO|nr:hypothetical protein HBH56_193020 [Parastagonospora nodorum]QRD02972.1 hypothetical protein JI435_441470 [Parastagonospora nodorum SN15]KAH3937841.1 hypothetical protein HBH54_008940 [Parastagonospora nodorum]KAH3938770.1 hypothetical protein HBH53_245440 [Parastagonospora nodorum]KAH3966465.1 hypothetical protein HBH52_197900 [Parastagonospora nodorum]